MDVGDCLELLGVDDEYVRIGNIISFFMKSADSHGDVRLDYIDVINSGITTLNTEIEQAVEIALASGAMKKCAVSTISKEINLRMPGKKRMRKKRKKRKR